MIRAAVVSRVWVLRMRPTGRASVSPGGPCTRGITATPVSKPERPSARRGKTSRARAEHPQRVAELAEEGLLPAHDHARLRRDVQQPGAGDDQVQQQVDGHQQDGDPDRLAEALQEDRPQDGHQHEGDQHLLPVQDRRGEGVLQDVRRGVGGGEGDGDDEVGGDEAEQDEDEELAPPPGQQALQHGDGALAPGALPGHPAVDRQRPQEGQQHQHQRRHRGQDPGGEEGLGRGIDAGLDEGDHVQEAVQAPDPRRG